MVSSASFGNTTALAVAAAGGDSSLGGHQIPSYIRSCAVVFCVLTMTLGIVGNLLVPIVILKTKDMRNSTNVFLMNLSLADLLVLLVCTPTVLVELNSKPDIWQLGKEMCVAVPFVEMTVAHTSVLTILAISFERYYAICEPLRAGYVCTNFRAVCICAMAWISAGILTSPILAIADHRYMAYYDGSSVPVCLTQATSFWPALYFLIITSLFFVVPLLILIVLYSIIAKSLMRTSSKVNLNQPVETHSLKGRRQVVLMLATVVLSFFFCLLPFRMFIVWIIASPEDFVDRIGLEVYYNILYFSRTMIYLNSAVNPILYNLMSSKFRSGFRQLCCSSKTGRRRGARNRRSSSSHVTASTSCQSGSSRDRRSRSLKVVYRKSSGESPAVMFHSTNTRTRTTQINEINMKLNFFLEKSAIDSPSGDIKKNFKRHSEILLQNMDTTQPSSSLKNTVVSKKYSSDKKIINIKLPVMESISIKPMK